MDEQELNRNKKLAELAGIRYEPDQDVFKVIFPDGSWYNIGHDWKLDEIEPDFLNDLNACFKWLVPKLREKRALDRIEYVFGHKHYGCFLRTKYWIITQGEGETPALALCLAIEKLIDGGTNE